MYWSTPGDGRVTFYKTRSELNGALAARLRGPWYSTNNLPSMCLSLLDQAERRRQSGRETDTILPARVRGAQKSRGTAGIVETACSCLRTRTSGRQRRQRCSDANRGYGLTCTQTHNLIDIKKQSILGAIVSNVFNVNGTLRGHLLLC